MYLMCPANKVEIMSVQEFTDDISAKREADSTVILTPAVHVLVGVWPEEVTEESCQTDSK